MSIRSIVSNLLQILENGLPNVTVLDTPPEEISVLPCLFVLETSGETSPSTAGTSHDILTVRIDLLLSRVLLSNIWTSYDLADQVISTLLSNPTLNGSADLILSIRRELKEYLIWNNTTGFMGYSFEVQIKRRL